MNNAIAKFNGVSQDPNTTMASHTKHRNRNQTQSASVPPSEQQHTIQSRSASENVSSVDIDHKHADSKKIRGNTYFETVPLGTPVVPLRGESVTTPQKSTAHDVSQFNFNVALIPQDRNKTGGAGKSRTGRKHKGEFSVSVYDEEEVSTAYNSEAQGSDGESTAPQTPHNLSSSTMETVRTKQSAASSTARARTRRQGSFSKSYRSRVTPFPPIP